MDSGEPGKGHCGQGNKDRKERGLIARPLDTRVDAAQRGDFSQFGQPQPPQDNAPFPAGNDENIPF